jgi:hypothetical protein
LKRRRSSSLHSIAARAALRAETSAAMLLLADAIRPTMRAKEDDAALTTTI